MLCQIVEVWESSERTDTSKEKKNKQLLRKVGNMKIKKKMSVRKISEVL